MSEYLKPESVYVDRYDLFTIEECLRHIKSWQKVLDGILNEEEKRQGFTLGLGLHLYHIKGERYRRKSSAIDEWMATDRNRDDKLEKAPEPQGICPNCSKKMKVIHKDLHDWDNSPLRVLFMFKCLVCKKRKGIFEDGKEYVSKPQMCPKCNKKLNVSYKEKGRIGTWLTQCSACDFKEEEIDDLDKKEAEYKERERQDEELLKKHRAEFCLSPAEGEEYIESMRRVDQLRELLDKAKEKQTDLDYQTVNKLNKWTIVELEKNLLTLLEKEKYQKLMLDKPEIDRYVIVPFTIQDADISRKEGDSQRKLQQFIKKALVGSNWRLMSEGVSYRLGYLSGRLKGYEREEDLLQLIKQEKQ